MSEDTLEWRLSEIEKKYTDFEKKNEEDHKNICFKNDEEHKEFLEFYHRLDKDMAIMAIKIGSITGAAAGAVSAFATWSISAILPKVAGMF